MTNHRRHNLEAKVRQNVMGAVNTRDQICLVAQQYTMKSNSDTLQLSEGCSDHFCCHAGTFLIDADQRCHFHCDKPAVVIAALTLSNI